MDFKAYVLLPAFNEQAALQKLIPSISEALRAAGYAFEITVADDGSSDGTSQVLHDLAEKYPVYSLRHNVNKGYGAALNTGYTAILSKAQPRDIVLSMDADTTHSPSYFPAMIKKIQEGFDVVTASYIMQGGKAQGVPFPRQIMSWGANTLFRLFFPVSGGQTYTNGFRAYKVAVLQRIQARYGDPLITQTGFPGGTELFLKSIKAGARIGEIPFTLHYQNRGSGSKIHLRATILGYLRLIRLALSF